MATGDLGFTDFIIRVVWWSVCVGVGVICECCHLGVESLSKLGLSLCLQGTDCFKTVIAWFVEGNKFRIVEACLHRNWDWSVEGTLILGIAHWEDLRLIIFLRRFKNHSVFSSSRLREITWAEKASSNGGNLNSNLFPCTGAILSGPFDVGPLRTIFVWI